MNRLLLMTMAMLVCISAGARGGETPAPVETVTVESVPAWQPSVIPAQEAAQEDERTHDLTSRLLQLRRLYGPEVSYARLHRRTATERTDTDVAAVSWVPHDQWRVILAAERAEWELDPEDEPDDSTTLASLEMRLVYDASESLQVWSSLMPYGGTDADGLGWLGGLSYQPFEWLQADLEAGAFLPWDDNFYGIRADGTRHFALARVGADVLPRLRLTAEGELSWYDTPDESSPVGDSNRISLRAESRVWDREGWSLIDGFRTPRQDAEDGAETYVSVYGAFEREEYDMDGGFIAVPVTPRTRDVRMGVSGGLAISPHWAITVDGYVGQDHARDIAWGDLYGIDTRLLVAPTGRVRVWMGVGMLSATGSAVAAGREDTAGAGVSINF